MIAQLPLDRVLATPLGRAIGRAVADVYNGLHDVVEIDAGATRVRVTRRQDGLPAVEFL